MIRYHSFYAAHREGEYDHLMNDHDRSMFDWVRAFNPYDLYSKGRRSARRRRLEALLSGADRGVLPGAARLVDVWRQPASGSGESCNRLTELASARGQRPSVLRKMVRERGNGACLTARGWPYNTAYLQENRA